MKAIKLFFKNFKLNHHSCAKHAKMIDSFGTSSSSTDGLSVGYSSVSVYKCEICGKKWDEC